MSTINATVMTCKYVRKQESVDANGATLTQNLYTLLTTDGKQFWANEPIRSGIGVSLTERKAGETYTKADGTVGTILKNGWNFNGVIGNASEIRGIKETMAALKDLDI